MLILGAHVNKGKLKDLFHTIQQIVAFNGNVVQIFIGSPQSTKIPEINEDEAQAIKKLLTEKKLILFSHSRYLINLSKKGLPVHLYKKELNTIWKLGGSGSVVHLGTCTGQPKEDAVNNMRNNLKKIIEDVYNRDKDKRKNLKLILETSAGCGGQLFTDIRELGEFYNSLDKEDQEVIGFCIDTCHIFAGGFDIRFTKGATEFLQLWDSVIGLDKIVLFHLNDSEDPFNSRKDRHAAIGDGFIGNTKLGGSLTGFKFILKFAERAQIPVLTERSARNAKPNELEFIRSLIS